MRNPDFDGKGSFYSNNRPSYPKEFVDYLYGEVGISADSVIADVGAGTGKLTRLLLERGSKVFAVEPNVDMRAFAEAELADFDNFVSVDSFAESTTLDDNSIDFVTVATAFHWFDRQAFRAECKRILRSGGKVIIVYNSRDEESDLVKRFYEVNEKYCPAFKGFKGSGTMLLPENAGRYNDFFTGGYSTKIIRNDLVYDEQSFIERSLSSSYALRESDANFSEYVNGLREFFQKHSRNGIMIMPNITHSDTGLV